LWALPAGAIFQALDHLYIFRYTLLGKKQPPIPLNQTKTNQKQAVQIKMLHPQKLNMYKMTIVHRKEVIHIEKREPDEFKNIQIIFIRSFSQSFHSGGPKLGKGCA
jgi:hypothetical protein